MLSKKEVEERAQNGFVTRPGFNLLLATDSYKISQPAQYPPDTTKLVTYYESRGQGDDPYNNGHTTHTLFIGNQIYLKRYLMQAITHADVEEAQVHWYCHFGHHYFNAQAWTDLVNSELRGKLPIRIWALPEGTYVKKHNALIMIETTRQEFFWVGQFIETLLSNQWKPISVGTLAFEMWKLGYSYARRTTSKDKINLDFLVNDFGMRGTSCYEDAGISGMAVLSVFLGTDNNAGIKFIKDYYNERRMPGFSVFATEHSTTTSWGKENELEAYRHFLLTAPLNSIKSIVGDSYDYDRFLKYLGTDLKSIIMAQTGKVVARPDSGYPPDQAEKTLQSLWSNFGGNINEFGYKELNPKVGCIYGDWINYSMMNQILTRVSTFDKFAIGTGNIIFGSGGGLLQQFTRDTHKLAMKACERTDVNGNVSPVYKITGDKSSKQLGKMMVIINKDGDHETIAFDENRKEENQLQIVFEDGVLIKDWTWPEIRSNVQKEKEKYMLEFE